MKKFFVAVLFLVVMAGVTVADQYFAVITAVDAAKGTIEFKVTYGRNKNKVYKADVTKDCVIRSGFYVLGKPAMLEEGEYLINGLKNSVFEKVNDKNALRVNLFTAEAEDKEKGIKEGDIVKILVNPKN